LLCLVVVAVVVSVDAVLGKIVEMSEGDGEGMTRGKAIEGRLKEEGEQGSRNGLGNIWTRIYARGKATVGNQQQQQQNEKNSFVR
jgi:hypothetical protein